MKRRIAYEVCCGCVEDVIQAQKGGADRAELNSALFLGGLTPSIGALNTIKRCLRIPVMAMVRPREAGFCYTHYDYTAMLSDARAMREAGVDGLVFGFLTENGSVDLERTAEFVQVCGDCITVFHRAIDLCQDPVQSALQVESVGVKRILTSGGKPTALEGAAVIREMQKVLTTCEVLPGGGINESNVLEVLRLTGANQVHASARSPRADTSARGNPAIFFGGKIDGKFLPEDSYNVTDIQLVRRMRALLDTEGVTA